jgi:hypothetical protein
MRFTERMEIEVCGSLSLAFLSRSHKYISITIGMNEKNCLAFATYDWRFAFLDSFLNIRTQPLRWTKIKTRRFGITNGVEI